MVVSQMIFLRFAWIIAVAFLMAACGGGGGSSGANPNQPSLVTTAGDSITLAPGAFQTYSVSGGVPPYRTSTSEGALVVASISDKTLAIGAVAAGVATVRVFDHTGTSIPITVTVGSTIPLFTTAPATVTLRAPGQRLTCSGSVPSGESVDYIISGGALPYSVESNQSQVVKVEKLDATKFRLTSMSRGSAVITVRDNNNRSTPVSIAVNSGIFTGLPPLTNSLDSVKITVGVESRVLLGGGMPPYFVSGTIPAAVTVSPACSDTGEFMVTGNVAGTFDVSFLDSAGSVSPKTKLEFMPDAASFRASPGAFQISEDAKVDFLEYQIFGFTGDVGTSVTSGDVCIYVSDPSYFQLDARTTCSTFSAGNRKFRLIRGSRGNLCVPGNRSISLQIIDSRGFVATGFTDDEGKLVPPVITILNNGTACEDGRVVDGSLTALPSSSVTLSPSVTVADVFIMGGSGSYAVRSSDATVASAVVDTTTSNRIVITRVGTPAVNTPDQVATITVTDLAAPSKIIQVIVTNKPPAP